MNNTIKHMREAKSSANCTSWGNKVVSVVLSVVLLGFGWPAVNPTEVYAEDGAANAGGSYQLAGDSASNAASAEGADIASRANGESAGSSSPALAGMESAAAGNGGDSDTPSTTSSTTSKGGVILPPPRTQRLRSLFPSPALTLLPSSQPHN